MKKPIALRVIFILNALMMILPFIFYYVFTTKDIQIEGLNPTYMIYTGLAYITSFSLLVFFILRKKLLGIRFVFVLNILIALPTKAYIGIGVAIISLVISFFSGAVKNYFSN